MRQLTIYCSLLILSAAAPEWALQPRPTDDPHTALGSVDGIVVDLDNKAVVNARVYAVPLDDIRPEARLRVEVLTDESGRFHLEYVPVGRVRMHAWLESLGYQDTSFDFLVTSKQSVPIVSISEGKTTAGVVVRLGPKGGRLSGSIVDAQTGYAIPNAVLTFVRLDNPKAYVAMGPDLAGKFHLPMPSNVDFRLKVSADHYADWWSGANPGGTDRGAVRLVPGGELKLAVRLQPK